jgi:hypothetical protein
VFVASYHGKKYLLIFFSHYDMFLFPVTGVHIAVKMLLLRCWNLRE